MIDIDLITSMLSLLFTRGAIIISVLAAALAISSAFSLLGKWLARRVVKTKIRAGGKQVQIDLSSPEESIQNILSALGEPQVFIACSFENKEFAKRLTQDLHELRMHTWLSIDEIRPGDNLRQKIEEGLRTSGYFLPIISQSFVASRWAQIELKWALLREQKAMHPRVIPILIEDVEIPSPIRERVYADFRRDYSYGLNSVVGSIFKSP